MILARLGGPNEEEIVAGAKDSGGGDLESFDRRRIKRCPVEGTENQKQEFGIDFSGQYSGVGGGGVLDENPSANGFLENQGIFRRLPCFLAKNQRNEICLNHREIGGVGEEGPGNDPVWYK
ncbi:hypothetical protein U1Q18_007786 [Sarracenia purpurea var. burkii]